MPGGDGLNLTRFSPFMSVLLLREITEARSIYSYSLLRGACGGSPPMLTSST